MNPISAIANFIKDYTSGVIFVLWAIGGLVISSLFIIFKDLGSIDFEHLKYVLILSAIWFLTSDISKRKHIFDRRVNFILDSVFYIVFFGSVIYFTGGFHGNFSFLFFLAAMAAAIFGTAGEMIAFNILLGIASFGIYFLTEPETSAYSTAIVILYILFYFIFGGMVKYFSYQTKQGEKNYRSLIETTPLCIKVFDESGKLLFINKGGREEHFIKEGDDISKWDWVGTIKQEYQQKAKEAFAKALNGEQAVVEIEHTPEGSSHGWCSGVISPIKDEAGNVSSVLFYSADVTALKKAELEAKKNVEIFHSILNSAPLCIKWFDKSGKLISINNSGKEEHYLIGKTEEEIKNWDYRTCIDKDYKKEVDNRLDMAMKGETSNLELKHAAGTSTGEWCFSTFAPVKNDKGDVEYVLMLSRDITEEKKINEERKNYLDKIEDTKNALFNILEDIKESEESLRKERDRSGAIITSMGEGLLVVDNDFKVVLMNKTAQRLLNIDALDMEGRDLRNALTIYKGTQKLENEEYPVSKVLHSGNVETYDLDENLYLETLTGKKFPVALVLAPLRGEGITGAVIIFRDVAEKKKLDEARSSFISIASHQLRTPLTAMSWFSEMLLDGDAGEITDKQKHFIDRIHGGTKYMIELVNLLLQIARVEAGRVRIDPKPSDLRTLTQTVISMLSATLDVKQQKIDIKTEPVDFPQIPLDEEIVDQVVQNLISNASRYSPRGSTIKILIKNNGDNFEYSVADEGIGIPKAQQNRLFDKFFRAQNALKMVPEGSGLGLSLVKSLVEGWGGKISFESEEGKGTTFKFTIPVAGMKPKEGEVKISV